MMRNDASDVLKASLMILVVVGHIFLEGVNQNAIKGAIYVFHMPVFLAISGYWFKAPDGIPKLLDRALSRYLVPWVIATIVFFIALWLIRGRIPFTILSALSDPWFHLWFIPALFLFCIFTTLLRKMPPIILILISLVPHICMWVGFDPRSITGPIDSRYITFGIYFAIGYAWKQYNPGFNWLFPAAILSLGIVLAVYLFPRLGNQWPSTLAKALITSGSIGLVHALSSLRLSWLSENIFSRESLAIYLYHYLPIMLVKEHAERLGSFFFWMVALIAGLIIVPLSIGAIRKIPGSEALLGTLSGRSMAPDQSPQGEVLRSRTL